MNDILGFIFLLVSSKMKKLHIQKFAGIFTDWDIILHLIQKGNFDFSKFRPVNGLYFIVPWPLLVPIISATE